MSRPERHPLPLHRPSDPAAPEFGWERFHAIAHELPPLFVEHGREISPDVPLDIDWDQYYALDVTGVLQVLTARVPTGQLVGYIFVTVARPLNHKQQLWATATMYWLDPVYRQGWTGVRMFKQLVEGCRGMKVDNLISVSVASFSDNRVTKLLQRLGFRPTGTMHSIKL
jgi:hypothetical protein